MFNFITQILDSAPEIWTNATQTAAAEFKARLATETVIRIYVDNTINFGNQASSVLLMQSLIDQYNFIGEGKNVWMVYKEEKASETRKKLSLLIKGFDASNPVATATYKGVTLHFITVEDLIAGPAYAEINYGFSGGADADDEKNWYATNLKVKIFLRLQAYLWIEGPQQIQYGGTRVNDDPFDLDDKAGEPGTFQQRNWYVSPDYWAPQLADWSYYSDDTNPGVDAETAARTRLCKVLTDFVVAQGVGVRFMPAYGIKGNETKIPDDGNQMSLPPNQLLPTVVSTSLGGSYIENDKTPGIVVLLNSGISDQAYELSEIVSKGGATFEESQTQESFNTAQANKKSAEEKLKQAKEAGQQDLVALNATLLEATDALAEKQNNNDAQIGAKNVRVSWLSDRNSPAGVKFLSSIERTTTSGGTTPAITPETLLEALTNLVAQGSPSPAVLFLELGSLPTILFNYVMSLGSYPNVFEGANSTNLALNQGKCYLRMQNMDEAADDPTDLSDIKTNLYPSAWAVGSEAYDAVHTQSINAGYAVGRALMSFSDIPANFVPNITLTTNYLSDYYITQEAALRAYYVDLQVYYHDPVNGKLGIGLAYMNQAAINIGIPAPQE